MKPVKNIFIGFAVSFEGSIPLGYLNLIGFQIYLKTNLTQLVYYLFGVVLIEVMVIYATLQFAHRLELNAKWKQRISVFSIFFLLFLAYYFYTSNTDVSEDRNNYSSLLQYPTLLTGLFFSCINFAQVPFWMSWNLYLVNGNYIFKGRSLSWFYIAGTLLGTFFGMLVLILGIGSISYSGIIHQNTLSKYIPLLFIGLALFQVFQLIINKRKLALK
ncbi:hypothetical protein [Flavobacterium sp.]|uniref:hypothetical protein n=1 Tax=Flavobacterium sp. TaxID=239 RepID=UPI003D6BEFAC